MMFRELSTDRFASVLPLFSSKHELPAAAVLRGQFPGTVFADPVEAPTLAVVSVSGRWLYIAGVVSSDTASAFARFLQDVCIPINRRQGWFEIYCSDDPAWDALFTTQAILAVQKHYEATYTLNFRKFQALSESVSHAAQGVDITMSHQALHPAANMAAFPKRTSLAAEIWRQGKLIAVCRDNGLRVGHEHFIDVDTFDPADRQKGLATLAAVSLIRQSLASGDIPLWETAEQNLASRRLAAKLGFEPLERYPVYAFTF